jgi:hypothetical protein
MFISSPGLRLSFVGGVVVLVSGVSLLLLPDLVSGVGMLLGACAVGGGFIWTMLEFYAPPSKPPPDA